MKQRQRIPSVALCLCLLITLLAGTVSAAQGAELVISGPQSVQAGESFTVTVELRNNPGFAALELTLPYDKEAMECTEVKRGRATNDGLFVENGNADEGAMVAIASATNVMGNGTLVLFSFTAKRTLSSLTFQLKDASLADENLEDIELNVSAESLETQAQTPDSGRSEDAKSDPQPEEEATEDPVVQGGESGKDEPKAGDPTAKGEESEEKPEADGKNPEQTKTAVSAEETKESEPETEGTVSQHEEAEANEPAPVEQESPVTTGSGTSGSTGSSGSGRSGGGVSSGAATGTGMSTENPEAEPETDVVPTPSFSDTAGHWGESFILEAAKRKLFSGYTDGRFGPDDKVTRGQLMVVLWNLAGQPKPEGVSPFTDLENQSQAFRDAINWAYGKGFVSGQTETTFGPNAPLERQAAMRILFNYQGGVSGMETMLTDIYDGAYTDSNSIASWAKSAVYWGVYHELLTGTSETTLSPIGEMTRAQLATIMVKFTDRFPVA